MERVTVRFQFRRGDQVHWAGESDVYTVAQQRVTIRDVLGPVHEYLITRYHGTDCWAYEADLRPSERVR